VAMPLNNPITPKANNAEGLITLQTLICLFAIFFLSLPVIKLEKQSFTQMEYSDIPLMAGVKQSCTVLIYKVNFSQFKLVIYISYR